MLAPVPASEREGVTSVSSAISPPVSAATFRCVACDYDLRSQPPGGVCPECATPVAESARIAALPDRPDWADSDPRWRRRLIAGLWVLAFLPVPGLLHMATPAYDPFAPYGFWDAYRDYYVDSLLSMTAPTLLFCVGAVLLFSRERGCRPRRLDAVRRHGALLPWLVLATWIAGSAGIGLLVWAGIDQMLNPPGDAEFIGFARYYTLTWGERFYVAWQALALATVVLAGLILWDALKRSGAAGLARVVVVVGLAVVGIRAIITLFYVLGARWAEDASRGEPFLDPYMLARDLVDLLVRMTRGGSYVNGYNSYVPLEPFPPISDVGFWSVYLLRWPLEAVTWLLIVLIAVRLTAVQARAWVRRRAVGGAPIIPTHAEPDPGNARE